MRDTCLYPLSPLSEASCVAQIHGNYQVVEVWRGIRGVVPFKAVLIASLLSLVGDESPHLVVVFSSENLGDRLLRDDTVDGSFL